MIFSKLPHLSFLRHFFTRTTKVFKEPAMDSKPHQEQEYQAEVTPQLDPASVIKKFRRDVLTKSVFTKEEDEVTKLIEEYDKDLRENLKKGTKDEQIMYSKKLIEKFVNQKSIFGILTKDPLLSNYGNYSAYKAATVKEERIQRQSWESTATEKGYKFIRNLGPEYMENQIIDEHLVESYEGKVSVEDYAKHIQRGINDTKRLVETLQTTPRTPTFKDYQKLFRQIPQGVGEDPSSEQLSPIYSNQGQATIASFNGQNNFGRLSPIARQEIYRCYLDGWTVRDISQRFGIHPRRTKFIIWARATYYTEVLPKLGFAHFKEVMLKELKYGAESGFVDYGLDLGFMKQEAQHFPKRITTWNDRMVDIKKDTDIEIERRRQKAIQRLSKAGISSKRWEKVLLGYFGKNNKFTELRDWKIFRSKGSDYQHTKYKTFRKLFKKTGRETYK